MCTSNLGLYIKLGQSVATMNHVLPPQYLRLFQNLHDRAPTVPFSDVERIFQEDFGKSPDQVRPVTTAALNSHA